MAATPARTPTTANDQALVASAQRGDPAAWTELLHRHGPVVYALCRRLDGDPDDAYQEIWEKLCHRLDRFDPTRGTLGGWIRTVARRHLTDRHRRLRRRGTVIARLGDTDPDPTLAQVADRGPSTDAQLHHRRQQVLLEAALQRLPPGQRRAVVLHHLEGLDLPTIASQEDTAVGTIKSRLHRARARLLRLMGGGA